MISVFTQSTTILWCSACVLIGAIMIRNPRFLSRFGVNPIVFILAVSIFRLFVPIELPFTLILSSDTVLPTLQHFMRTELLTIGRTQLTIGGILIAIWLVVGAGLLVRLVQAICLQRTHIYQIKTVYDAKADKILQKITREEGKIPKKYKLIVSDEVQYPMITGFFTPTILLPILLVDEKEMEFILRHEWKHYRHKDIWMKLLVNLVCAIFWWNPFVYILKRDLDHAMEIKADVCVMHGLSRHDKMIYMGALLKVMERMDSSIIQVPANTLGFASTNGTRQLRQRFAMIISEPKSSNKKPVIAYSAFVLLLIFLSYSILFQPASYPDTSELGPSLIEISQENAYIQVVEDNTYYLVVEDLFIRELTEKELQIPPHNKLEIRK